MANAIKIWKDSFEGNSLSYWNVYSAQPHCYAYYLYQLTFNLDASVPAAVSECSEKQGSVATLDTMNPWLVRDTLRSVG